MSKPILESGKVILVYGKKGAGKSIYLASCAFHGMAANRIVFSNFDCKGCLPLPERYWDYAYPPSSILLIDEVALIHRNRDFKSFEKDTAAWYKMVRKFGITVVLSSQIDDVDKTLRSSADYVIRFHTKYQLLSWSLSIGDVWINTLVVQPQVDENGKASGAAEIAMGLSRKGSKLKCLYLQNNRKYYSMYDTLELFTHELLPLPNDLPAYQFYLRRRELAKKSKIEPKITARH